MSAEGAFCECLTSNKSSVAWQAMCLIMSSYLPLIGLGVISFFNKAGFSLSCYYNADANKNDSH